MITLYVKTGCPFCMMVQSKVSELGIEVNELNVADEGIRDQLIEKGGERQVPFMIDEECGVQMYESSDIIEYLDKKYGDSPAENGAAPKGVCPA